MGRKVHPRSYRTPFLYQWKSKWFDKQGFAKKLQEDIRIRKFLQAKLKDAGVASVEIERLADAMTVLIHTSRPGVVIGRGGTGIEELKQEIIRRFFPGTKPNLTLTILEVTKPQLNAELVVKQMVEQLEKRMPFRRVLRQTVSQVEKAGALGVKVMVAGRLNGAEIARTEFLSSGRLPLQTLRADIDYSRGVVHTNYGSVGVRVWIYKGDIFHDDKKAGDGSVVGQETR